MGLPALPSCSLSSRPNEAIVGQRHGGEHQTSTVFRIVPQVQAEVQVISVEFIDTGQQHSSFVAYAPLNGKWSRNRPPLSHA